jgi:hypothetical protein
METLAYVLLWDNFLCVPASTRLARSDLVQDPWCARHSDCSSLVRAEVYLLA